MSNARIIAASLVALTLLLTVLSLHVSRLRLRHRVSFGDGGHKDLLLAMRAHGNSLEQTALFAALGLAGAQLPAFPAALLLACSAGFVVARYAHAWALFARWLRARQLAHGASLLAQLGLASGLAWQLVAGP